MPSVFRLRAANTAGQPVPGVFDELQGGHARIGWSYQDDLDLRHIHDLVNRHVPLNADQRRAKRCLPFYTDVCADDYVIYQNQPRLAHFSIVQIAGKYGYSPAGYGLNDTDDFRSLRPCTLLTQEGGIWTNMIRQRPHLRRQILLPGRFAMIHDPMALDEFFALVESL